MALLGFGGTSASTISAVWVRLIGILHSVEKPDSSFFLTLAVGDETGPQSKFRTNTAHGGAMATGTANPHGAERAARSRAGEVVSRLPGAAGGGLDMLETQHAITMS